MPYIRMFGPMGDAPSLSSSNWATIYLWLDEWLRKMWGPGTEEWGEPRLIVQPLSDGHTLDWLGDTRAMNEFITIPRRAAQAVVYLEKYRAEWKPAPAREKGQS